MTSDSYLFDTKPCKQCLPLYKGKMINQFENYSLLAKYWVNENEGRKAILGKNNKDKGYIFPYQTYRLGLRAVA